jgi:hypothetical protein
MLRRIVFLLFGLVACAGYAYRLAAQQAPSSGAQPAARGGRRPGAPVPPPLLFRETWRLMRPPHAIAPGEAVVSNANLEFKMYGPPATALGPDKRIWLSGSTRSGQW